ncbi:hypothetical protein L6164_009188 [Bauhinia variegata]|uniref:Uncharacterized protein n=1 Tax=Bauhinia variegata TaxID=167791 RepID=A0ACB9PIX5_BAUVA|nr:hypothetical protein L6164_009188 [Bauhinia variegata]
MDTASKLIVEVVEASNLLPKDEHGTSSPYAVVDFYGQRKKTPTAIRDLNPTWNATLAFDVGHGKPSDIFGHVLELNVFHDKNHGPTRRNGFLGRIRLSSDQFVRKGEEALMYCPLEKKGLFNLVQGFIGLKVYLVDEEIPHPPAPPAEEMKPHAPPPESESKPPAEAAPPPESSSEKVEESPASPPQPYQPPTAEPPPEGGKLSEEPPVAEKSEGPATENAAPDSEKPSEPEPPQPPIEENFGLSETT